MDIESGTHGNNVMSVVGSGKGVLESRPIFIDRDFFVSEFGQIVFRSELTTPFRNARASKVFHLHYQGRISDIEPRRAAPMAGFTVAVNGIGDLQFQPKAHNLFD
jgi:hypothetical protein